MIPSAALARSLRLFPIGTPARWEMFKRALVVFENERVSPEAVLYARELALRMDAEVTLLMLIEMSFLDQAWLGSKRNAISDVEERVGALMSEHLENLMKAGVTVSAALRVGDPAQEFIKFLAERSPYQAVIWGSGKELPEGAPTHWMVKAASSLECPLWTVDSRGTPV